MADNQSIVVQASCVAILGRALVIEGPPASGKSSLTLALIDRGAQLIGDDGVTFMREDDALIASPPPNIAGLLEIRGVGLIKIPTAPPSPISLILQLGGSGERLPENAKSRDILGVPIPVLPFEPGPIAPAQRAEWALKRFGLDHT